MCKKSGKTNLYIVWNSTPIGRSAGEQFLKQNEWSYNISLKEKKLHNLSVWTPVLNWEQVHTLEYLDAIVASVSN